MPLFVVRLLSHVAELLLAVKPTEELTELTKNRFSAIALVSNSVIFKFNANENFVTSLDPLG